MDIADKIRKIEALISGAKSDGERQAAEFAKQRLQDCSQCGFQSKKKNFPKGCIAVLNVDIGHQGISTPRRIFWPLDWMAWE
jgi:hypothetical protein